MSAMKSPMFWITRFLQVLALVFVILLAAEIIKGGTVAGGWLDSAIWSSVAATVFTGSRYYRARRGQACALCQDLPQG